MEANEAGELQEHAEHGAHEPSMRPVAFTMSVLAVLVAITTVLGHRTHTEAVITQNKTTDQWNEYQAKKIRSYATELDSHLLSVIQVTDAKKAQKLVEDNAKRLDKWKDELPEEQKKAEQLEKKVEQAEARANRFDLGEALLEIALVVSSITLLTKNRLYWLLGLGFGVLGIISSASVLLLK
jgi:predicted RNase H-like nuclease (RuvC/YqgF family)